MEKSAPVSEFESYLLYEWNQFKADSSRARATLQAVAGLDVGRVLDIGCGAGQEMLPLIEGGAFGVGIHYDPEAGTVGRRLFASTEAVFARCSGEDLPFRSESFDVLICRWPYPYMDNAKAFAEMSRVLRGGSDLPSDRQAGRAGVVDQRGFPKRRVAEKGAGESEHGYSGQVVH